MFTLFFYLILITVVSTSLYLTVTASHIYIYFLVVFLGIYILKNYVAYVYALYINFYWSALIYNILFSVTGSSIACALHNYYHILNYYINFIVNESRYFQLYV